MAGFDLLAAALRSSSPQAHSARSSNALLPFCEAFSNYIEGYQRLADLDTAWERSVLAMFVVSEVHPFDDGNGRVARIMMNAELQTAGQMRTIIPTVFRDDYLGALRRLSRQEGPSVLIKALRFANDWTARIDFSDLDGARDQMAATQFLRVGRGRCSATDAKQRDLRRGS